MDKVKTLIGLVAGLFCTLAETWLCSVFFDAGSEWYSSLAKPDFAPSGCAFTALVSLVCLSTVLSVARLVVSRKFFPPMIFLALTGFCAAMFFYSFFSLNSLLLSLMFVSGAFLLSFALQIILFFKDAKAAAAYIPSLAFNAYGFVVVFCITMMK